jgi:transcriptional regulator with XRE-family HTH domain
MDRRDTVRLFRERLIQVIEESRLSQTAFAQAVGMDRSTLSQLLSAANDRLPRVESVVGIAAHCQTSVDWLLGLSQRRHLGADTMQEALQVERDAPSPVDDRLMRWHAEAAGYKIRHVPSTFPDLLKTEEVIRFQYAAFATRDPQRGIETAQARLAYLRRPETDMEACNALHVLEGFARAEGIWQGLDARLRRAQIEHLIALCEELYPTFRWFLYDGRRVYSAPVTIFGPLRAAVYMGQMYFVFTSTDNIRTLTRHFDDLIRAAIVQPTEVPAFLRDLLKDTR